MTQRLENTHALIDHRVIGWILLATVLAAGLRLYKLDEGSFWLDELYTINTTARLSEMHNSKALGYVPTFVGLRVAGIDPSHIPPASASWQSMGLTERVVRLPTAILGILTVPIIGLASVRLLGARGAMILAFLLAVSPWHIYWSQAARFYVPQFLFYSLSIIYYFIATRNDSKQYFIAAMVCMVLAFLSQPTALIIIGVFGADWAIARLRGEPLRLAAFHWTVAATSVALCAAIIGNDIWLAPAQWTHFVEEGARHQSPIRMVLGAAYMIGPVVVTFALLTAAGCWNRDSRFVLYFAAAAMAPIIVFTFMSAWAFVGLRYSFVALIGWLALTAWGADIFSRAVRPRLGWVMAWLPLTIVFAAMAMSNFIYFNSNGNFHARWKEAAEYVKAARAPGDQVAATDVHTAEYYLEEAVAPLPSGIQQVQALTEPTWFIVEVNSDGGSGRFWMFQDAELREVYALRAAHTTSSVQVYKFQPMRHITHE